jgi:hypothetical protein
MIRILAIAMAMAMAVGQGLDRQKAQQFNTHP